jgi:hypothetical protein
MRRFIICGPSNIVQVIKSRDETGWTNNRPLTGGITNADIFVRKPQSTDTLGRPRHTGPHKMDLGEIGCEGMG